MTATPFGSGFSAFAVAQSVSYRLLFLGKQGLNGHTNTGFGSLQQALRELYFGHLNLIANGASADTADRITEKTLSFQESGVNFRFWDPRARQFQQDFYPFEAVTSLDLVHFHTVKGRKRRFGYFRRHSDAADVIPDTVLIPLRRRQYRQLRKMQHKPMLCIVTRRPYGIQFLECQLFLTDTEAVGLSFVEEFDVRSRIKRLQQEQQQQQQPQQLRYNPWFDRSHWASQPTLFQGQTMVSDASESTTGLTPNSTADSSRLLLMRQPLPRSKEALIERYRELQPLNLASEYSCGSDGTEKSPPPLPPRNRQRRLSLAAAPQVPPVGGVRVLPGGPPPEPSEVLRHQPSIENNGIERVYGKPSRFTAIAHVKQRTYNNQDAGRQGIVLDDGLGCLDDDVDFGTALGYLP